MVPSKNLKVEFKGNALHRVGVFHAPSGNPCISLVWKQNRILEAFHDRTVEFCVNEECGEMENDS